MIKSTRQSKEPGIFDAKSQTSKVFSLKSQRQDNALKTLTSKAIFNPDSHLEGVVLKDKIKEVLKTDSKSNIEAMGSFIKTLEDEFEREKKIAE